MMCGVNELFFGGNSDGVTPGSMPNPEVKPVSADGTVWGTHGRVGLCQKIYKMTKRGALTAPASSSAEENMVTIGKTATVKAVVSEDNAASSVMRLFIAINFKDTARARLITLVCSFFRSHAHHRYTIYNFLDNNSLYHKLSIVS